jgi:hypothetical protein
MLDHAVVSDFLGDEPRDGGQEVEQESIPT